MPSTSNDQYAPSSWVSSTYEFVLPSGDKCLLNKIDPLTLAEAGLMDKLDFATNVVMNTHAKNANMTTVERVKRERAKRAGQDPDEDSDRATMQEIMRNAENSRVFREVLDQMMVVGVAAPKMHLPPEDGAEKELGKFYTDAVPFADKMAVFNELMKGVRATEQFREGSEEGLGDVAPKPSVRKPAERSARAPRKRSAS
jgi:hypothetical protein